MRNTETQDGYEVVRINHACGHSMTYNAAKVADLGGDEWIAKAEKVVCGNCQARAPRKPVAPAVEGLDELGNATRAWAAYHAEMSGNMQAIANGDASAPQKPSADLVALRAKYPVAACYLRADGFADAANHHKASAGAEAKKILTEKGDVAAAEKILENWLPEGAEWR